SGEEGSEDHDNVVFAHGSRLTPTTLTIGLPHDACPHVRHVAIEKGGYQRFLRPFLCKAGLRHVVNARLSPAPECKWLRENDLRQMGLSGVGHSGVEVDLDKCGAEEVVVVQRREGDYFPIEEIRVFRPSGGEHRLVFYSEVTGLYPVGQEVCDLNDDGLPEVLLEWHSGGSTAEQEFTVVFAVEEDIRSADAAGYHVRVAQLDDGGACEIMMGTFVGMARGKTDATIHDTIWHWDGQALVDVSHEFPEYYEEIEIPYLQARLETAGDDDEYRAELQEAIGMARAAVAGG
ncbi:MAG: hypothetical protein ACE5O2_09795, partial [Armatimonadota bacterium]